MIEPGFTEVMHWQKVADEGVNSLIEVGMKCKVQKVTIADGVTTAPGFLTEADLISLVLSLLLSYCNFF